MGRPGAGQNGRFPRVAYKKEDDFISVAAAVKKKKPFEGQEL